MALVADLYWIRALQHFGHERLSPPEHERNYALLYPLLDLTTTLDPISASRIASARSSSASRIPAGPGRPDLAIALLQKGLAAQPEKWQYMQDLGFVYYWHLQDYHGRGRLVPASRRDPGRAELDVAACRGDARGGRAASRVARAVAAAREGRRAVAPRFGQQRLLQLDAMDAMDALDARVRDYRLKHPGAPLSWDALRAAGYVRGVPLDPTNTPYIFTAAGRVTISRESKLWPLPGQSAGLAQ